MTLLDLIRELQELDIDPSTPVHFSSNYFNADEPFIELQNYFHDGSDIPSREVVFRVYSEELEKKLEEISDC